MAAATSKCFRPCLGILRSAKRPMRMGEIVRRLNEGYPDIPIRHWGILHATLNRACDLSGSGIRCVATTPRSLYQHIGDPGKPTPQKKAFEATPEELFGNATEKAEETLTERLRRVISAMHAHAFEELANRLIVRMGFGKKHETTPKRGDGGVDGIIFGDELGLNTLCVQAKHYQPGNAVRRPAILQFIGARHGRKGIFITSSSFSKQAQDEAEKSGIALIDGEKLVTLLIKHKVGIVDCQTYVLQDVDEPYYERPHEEYAHD